MNVIPILMTKTPLPHLPILTELPEWDAHVDRMGNNRIVKVVRDNGLAGRRALRGPRTD